MYWQGVTYVNISVSTGYAAARDAKVTKAQGANVERRILNSVGACGGAFKRESKQKAKVIVRRQRVVSL